MSLTREIQFQPGYDYRAEDAHKPSGQRRGCHGLNMRWLVHGEHGSVQFLVYTMWLPSWVREAEWGPRVVDEVARRDLNHPPMAADLGHHWDWALYHGENGPRDCDVRPSGKCFYDGSGLNAEPLLAALLTKGHDEVWAQLEAYYEDCDGRSVEVD